MIRRVRKITLGLLAISATFAIAPMSASAHSASNAPSSNFHGTVTSVNPETDSFEIAVIEATSRAELTWKSGPEISVAGYDDEPYLRIGPTGVSENQASSTTYLNRDRQGATPLPSSAGPGKSPVWKRIIPGPTARWHDHRVHWMGTTIPPIVARNPRRPQLVQTWTIPIAQGPATYSASGRLDWKPGPRSFPHLFGAGAFGTLTILAMRRIARNEKRRSTAALVLAGAALVLTAVDVTHLFAITSGIRGPGVVGRIVSIGIGSIAAWIAVVVGAALLLRRRLDGTYPIVFGAAVMVISGGLADISVLSNSATAASLPIGVVRNLVTVTIGLGTAIVGTGILLTTRPPGRRPNVSKHSTRGTPVTITDHHSKSFPLIFAAVVSVASLLVTIVPDAANAAANPTTPTSASTSTQSDVYVAPTASVIAAATAARTPIYEASTSTKPFVVLDNKTNFSGRHVFLVIGNEPNGYRVLVPMRPNGRTGYVKATDVDIYQHDYAILVSLGERRLTVYKGGKEIMRESAGIGQDRYPTPTGRFFARELARPGNPRGSYGPWAFGLSGYSNVLLKFGKGDGQIAIHGTNEPKKLGTKVSHGCIRIRNVAITKLAQTLPQGVPVDIRA